jgi:ferredoxin
MTYVVGDTCFKCKLMDCVEARPVDCFYEGENMVVIHPNECIDRGVSAPECPREAIKPASNPGMDKWLAPNAEYAGKWPNIVAKKTPATDAADMGRHGQQIRAILLPNPGTGDQRSRPLRHE